MCLNTATGACSLADNRCYNRGFFWLAPTFQPDSHIAWALPGWIAGAYLFMQILFLLVSATQVRALGVFDSIIAIVPIVAGLVMVVEWLLGHLPLSLFQLNCLGC